MIFIINLIMNLFPCLILSEERERDRRCVSGTQDTNVHSEIKYPG